MPRTIRQIRIVGNIAFVPLTRGYEAVIDAADVPLVNGFNWQAMVTSRSVYAQRTDRTDPKPRSVRMHRTIVGEPAGLQVDHIDGDGLNNQRDNLREVTPSQNAKNQRKHRDNTSDLKGVSFHKRDGKWSAQIGVDGKQKHLGYFDTKEEAYLAYCEASAKYHGEFGRVE